MRKGERKRISRGIKGENLSREMVKRDPKQGLESERGEVQRAQKVLEFHMISGLYCAYKFQFCALLLSLSPSLSLSVGEIECAIMPS